MRTKGSPLLGVWIVFVIQLVVACDEVVLVVRLTPLVSKGFGASALEKVLIVRCGLLWRLLAPSLLLVRVRLALYILKNVMRRSPHKTNTSAGSTIYLCKN